MNNDPPKPETIDFYEFPFRLNSTIGEFKINDDLVIKKMNTESRKRIFGITKATFGENGLLTGYKGGRHDYEDGALFMNKQHLRSSNYVLITSESNISEDFNLALKLLGLSCTSLYIGYGNPVPNRRFIKNCFYDLSIPPLLITEKEVPLLCKLVNQITSNSNNKKFKLLSDIYINAMSDKIRTESRYLELSIMLEALILPNKNSELNYRFRLRLAKFLHRYYELPMKEVFTKGKDIYELRSDIVHSGKSKKNIDSLTKVAHEYVHKLMWKYLEDESLFSEENLEELCLE